MMYPSRDLFSPLSRPLRARRGQGAREKRALSVKPETGWRLTALAALVRGRVDAVADGDGIAGGGLDGVLRLFERLARDDAVDIWWTHTSVREVQTRMR